MSLQLRYLKLLKGLPLFFTHKITFALIAIILAINFILLKRSIPNFMKTRVFKVLLLITVLCTVYILLLPFGGYRPYRPIIVRYDTFLPITIVLILLIGISSFQLIMVYLNGRLKVAYAVFLIGILAIFMISDFNELPNNECQKAALYEIKSSKKKIVKLQNNCTVLSWFIMPDQNYTSDIGKMLHYWDISQTEILFYQEVN